MNQQRSRRFRTAQEAKEKAASEDAAWEELTRMFNSFSSITLEWTVVYVS